MLFKFADNKPMHVYVRTIPIYTIQYYFQYKQYISSQIFLINENNPTIYIQ